MKSAQVTCLGKSVALHEFGSTNLPAVLLIHGNSVHSGFFLPLINLLELKYHVIILDLPGHRQSEPWKKEEFGRENLALLFNAVLDNYKIRETNAFGFSMGGFMLLECFDLVPAIKKIAIAGHPPLHSMEDMSKAYYLNEDSSLFLKGPLSDEEIERLYNSVISLNDEQLKGKIIESIRNTSPEFREGCLNMAQQTGDQVARLNKSRMPIAVIHASEDKAVQFDYLQSLQIHNLWEQKIQTISGCGHFCITDKTEELATMLDKFYTSA